VTLSLLDASSGLVWEDPPPDCRGRRPGCADEDDHELFAAALRARPMRWARLPLTGTGTGAATNIASGRLAPYRPAGSFEAVRRTIGGQSYIFARYVGQASS
jgi:hypothetical protein